MPWIFGKTLHLGVIIDAVVSAGRSGAAVLVGEAKWAKIVDGERVRRDLEKKVASLPTTAGEPLYAVCARETIVRVHPSFRLLPHPG